ncbi:MULTISPECIES: hypothetical protein [Aliivibrio]|uniref:Threonine transporter RhtB n=1 Tax=Aliivibrio logei 5S-186 TaxID=626086 RepID=A0ABX3AUK1_ALILO|nr:hypothetical protein [Aliivibrio logei]OEF11112.1 hypothetical protein A1Q5_11765 [Aliivibrio logei 5S-186]
MEIKALSLVGHPMYKAVAVFILLISIVLPAGLWLHSSSQLNYFPRNIDWSWSWSYYEPLSNGLQVGRTKDTKQLILRRVNRANNTSIYVDTTYTNTFEVVVIHEAVCQPKSRIKATLQIGDLTPETTSLICNDDGTRYLFRQVWRKLSNLYLKSKDFSLSEDFSNWPLGDLKKDQFMQLHPTYFRDKGEADVYEWSRD